MICEHPVDLTHKVFQVAAIFRGRYCTGVKDRSVKFRVMAGCTVCVGLIALALATAGIVYWLKGGKQAKLDAATLDGLILTGGIDRVEFVSDDFTNVLTGAAAQNCLLLLSATNRVAKADLTKSQLLRRVGLLRGTNVLGRIDEFENDLWQFENYSFRMRKEP